MDQKKRNKLLTLQMVDFLNYMENSLEITNWSCLTSDSSFSKINNCSHFSYLIRDFMCKMTKCIIYSKPLVLFHNKWPSVLWFDWGFLWWPEKPIIWQMVWEELVFLKVSRQRCFKNHPFSSSSNKMQRWDSWYQHFKAILSAFLNHSRYNES